jgi:hypothetical protein
LHLGEQFIGGAWPRLLCLPGELADFLFDLDGEKWQGCHKAADVERVPLPRKRGEK